MTKRNGRRGFTLIELGVVITIIVILIAILVPVIGKARVQAKVTATTAQLHGLQTACESYATYFNNQYPGPLQEDSWGRGVEQNFSSSQALLVSLTRRFSGSPQPTTFTIPAGSGINLIPVSATPGNDSDMIVASSGAMTPVDNGTQRNYDAFVTPKPNETSEAMFGASDNTKANLRTLPCFVDFGWKSPLPILYYRAARKYDPTTNNLQISDQSSIVPATFYTSSNSYLSTAIAAAQPASFPDFDSASFSVTQDAFQKGTWNQNAGSLVPASKNGLLKDLCDLSGGVWIPKGKFVLIAAGPDRLFGTDNNGSTDDIVVSGGN